MTAIWLVYYTIRLFMKKDTEGDALLVIPCLLLDGLISGILT